MPTAPHLAEPRLTLLDPAGTGDFRAAALRVFGDEHDPELWPSRAVLEPERMFGFTVDGRWIATCGAYTRTMTVPGGQVPVAAVSFVSVSPGYRRRGLLNQMMRHQLDDVVARGTEPVALLWASEAPIYGRYGYGPATARLRVTGATRDSAFRPDVDLGDGSVGEVEPDEWRAAVAGLHAAWLPERPGALDRTEGWWSLLMFDHPSRRGGASPLRFALHHDREGEPDGYLAFRVRPSEHEGPAPGMRVEVTGVDGASPSVVARLWRFVLDLDLVASYTAEVAVDEPLPYLLRDPRSLQATFIDGTYARLVDLPRALEARRYAAAADLVLEVQDAWLPQNAGRFRLRTSADGAVVTRVDDEPDVALDVRELGAVYLGGTAPAALHRAGLLAQRSPGAVASLTAAFAWSRQPYCSDFF